MNRKRLLPARAHLLAAALALAAPVLHAAPAPAASPAADCLFNWAETRYPELLAPAGGAAQVEGDYYYRAYGQGSAYLAVGRGRVWYATAGAAAPLDLGALGDWLNTASCASADTTAPRVLYTSRTDGAIDAAVNARVVAAFSEPVEVSGTLAEAIRVVRDDGAPVPGSTRYDPASATLTFTPAGDLEGGRRYEAQLTAALRDLAGNPLAAYRWQFTTQAGKRNGETEQALQQTLDRAIWRYAIPGATMAVVRRDGSLWTAAAGYANLSTRAPMTSGALFRMGSNTKTFVATAVLQLVDAGKLSLDAPINTWLASEMRAYLPAYDGSRITVRHLLNHTSGIYNFTLDANWGNAFIYEPDKRYFPQELLLLANAGAGSRNAPVFGQFSYSNTNYVLLGLLLKKAGGSVYEDTIRQAVTQPLGLGETTVPRIGDAEPPAGTARGYYEDGETSLLFDETVKDPSTVWASGNMITDIDDLARWALATGRGALISPAMQAARRTYVPMTSNLEYGLGVVRDRTANLIGHQGGMIGYTSQTYYVVDEDAAIAFFYNRTLAMHDYSAVMTYDALRLLWPERYASLTLPQSRVEAFAAPQGRPGLLAEY